MRNLTLAPSQWSRWHFLPYQELVGSNQTFSYTTIQLSYRTLFLRIRQCRLYLTTSMRSLEVVQMPPNMITDDPKYRYAPFWSATDRPGEIHVQCKMDRQVGISAPPMASANGNDRSNAFKLLISRQPP